MVGRWCHGPITLEQHEAWKTQPHTLWFWTVLWIDLDLKPLSACALPHNCMKPLCVCEAANPQS